ncbi:MAG: response regulator [Acidobacteria bacterium]|nr:response regulator [Acidobacteriota bacterium]MCA1610701.1 response regulator [Acidobacteriota bacterium]
MPPAEKVNILAVDDSPDKLLAISVVLAELDQNVVTACSGRDALRAILTSEFAVILLDVNMPGMDGFETAAMIRQRRNSEHTPIIFITSYDETLASRGYSLGAVDYILAPVEPEVLKTKVMVFVELFRKTAQIREQARALELKARQLQSLTEASLAINSALSPDEMLQIVSDMAREIIGAHQAVAVAAVDQKWLQPSAALSLSRRYAAAGERSVLRDRTALLSFLSQVRRTVRVARGSDEEALPWRPLLASDRPARLGWLAAPMSGRDGRPLGLIHLMDKRDGDFTEEDEAILTQLAQMSSIAIENTVNAEAREANRIKDEFLTTLSHELRTPLSAIMGWTRTLRTGASADPVKIAHGLEVIERNVSAQTKLIDDLLDVSRIITGKLRLNVRPAALGPIIESALDAMRPAAEGKNIQITVEHRLPAGEDVLVGDPDRLQQVVWNLVSNAIKFTPAGGRVTVELVSREGEFEIVVSDTGRGISQEFLPRVFERFRQADSTTTRTQGGLGIGLAIARHLLELHGGTISAHSDGDGAGSRFNVVLPRVALGIHNAEARGSGETPPVRTSPEEIGDIRGLSILVVEDEADGRELLVELLGAAGARVTEADSVRAALEIFANTPPDLLVSDIGMPGEDGYALMRAVRALPVESGGAVPALAVTAYAREEDRLRALSSGFQGHVAKPIDPDELVRQIARVWKTAAARRSTDPKAPGREQPTAVDNRALMRVLVVEDDLDSREGLKNLLEIWGHAVDVAGTGKDGIEQAILHRPRVALIDIGLPELDGYQVAQRIREALGSSDIFLVAITGYADARERAHALENGFDAHVAKPIDFSKLSSILEARAAS